MPRTQEYGIMLDEVGKLEDSYISAFYKFPTIGREFRFFMVFGSYDRNYDIYAFNIVRILNMLISPLLQYAPNCLEHRKCIKMDLKCPTIVLNCLHILDYIFMVDLKSKNLHMGTHKIQN